MKSFDLFALMSTYSWIEWHRCE